MSHVIRVVLTCNGGGCGAEYASSAGSATKARRHAERDGWAAGIQSLQDGRIKLDYCPACAASHGYGRLTAQGAGT